MNMNNLKLVLLMAFALAIGEGQAQQVVSVSNMRKVMTGQDLGATLNWDTIPKAGLYGLSPYGRISGEATIIDGITYVSRVDADGAEQVAVLTDVPAPFGVYAHVKAWHQSAVDVNIDSEMALQTFIESYLAEQGHNLDEPTAVMIRGEFASVAYHIISKPTNELDHDHDMHDQAKRHFVVHNTAGELLCFYSKHHQGIFTHRGSFLHSHFIDQSRSKMGHLESLAVKGKVVVMLPMK